jgi:hypothetical protein
LLAHERRARQALAHRGVQTLQPRHVLWQQQRAVGAAQALGVGVDSLLEVDQQAVKPAQ